MDKKVNGTCVRKWKAQKNFGLEGEEIADAQLRGVRERIPPVTLNGKREVTGVLRGFDQFMNIVLDNCVEITADGTNAAGMVVVRGNSITAMEAAEPL